MNQVNVFEDHWDAELPSGESTLRATRLAARAGARALAANLYEVEPGALVSPMHYHHRNEELLLVLAGTPTLRTPDAERVLAPGEVVAFPAGPEGVHQVVNRSAAVCRVLICATNEEPEVAEQVEDGQVAVIAGGALRVFPAAG